MIEIHNLKKTYNSSFSKIEALKNISFKLENGDILGILGPNGAGKSTLIKILSTVVDKDSGEILIDNCSIDNSNEYRKKFTVVMQDTSIESWLSVEENLKVYGKFYGISKKKLPYAINDVVNLFNLNKYRKKKASELSGGFRKRLQLAKSFLVNTPIMMFDEPTVGLDPFVKLKVIESLKKKSLDGKTIIFTTQILSEVESLCNKVMILSEGTILSKGHIDDIKEKFEFKKKLIFQFENLTDELYKKALTICKNKFIKRKSDSILFDLSMKNKNDKILIHKLLDTLNPISISVKEPTFEEIFIDIVKEKL
ncbi:ABC transporter ATP-binding protein [Clostridium felsineum]|uniref:ABC transporter ATP-binding protein n=1 Tax=Clostridium felsineum TaxID=36839 RepID=UPI00098C961A|nr:ABC transporter ATP-binding protein [Clostridium felsineum]URZ14078.1 Linearmycin resistance ATP-binding protein LnrL [Clostridium felsineum DSM 794]